DPNALGLSLPDGSSCTSDMQCAQAQDAGHDIGHLCNLDAGECVPERDCLRPLKFWSGGLTFYGGPIMCALFLALWTRRTGWRYLNVLDICAPGIAVGLAFGRLGCFLSGCCFGQVCDLPWAVTFPRGSDAWNLHREENRQALIEQFERTGEW